jgi:hypothetical protein
MDHNLQNAGNGLKRSALGSRYQSSDNWLRPINKLATFMKAQFFRVLTVILAQPYRFACMVDLIVCEGGWTNKLETLMNWFYEVRDSNKQVVATAEGFSTQSDAKAAGRKAARELKAAGKLGPHGTATIETAQRIHFARIK